MDHAQQLATAKAAYEAYARGDVDALIGMFSEDAVWDATDALWATGTFFGHAGIRDYFGRLAGMWDALTLDDYEIELVRDGLLLARGRLRGRERATGQDADSPFLHWIDIDAAGKLTRLRILVDPDRFA